jgi:limonene-1,2-epoxide hydrolase
MALLKRKRVGLNDAMSVVTRFVNACNRHDADGVASCLHPDFDSIQPMYPSRNFRGADQVRRNWQAIFDAEPGFRLTVLRSAAMDDTVWLELHGAGRDAEVAGVFVMGIQGDRIRWARIYSALVEPVPAGVGEEATPGQLQEVPPLEGQASAGNGAVVDEPLIAPVLDMDRSGRRRRRRRGAEDETVATDTPDGDETTATVEEEGGAEPVAEAEPEAAEAVEVVEMVEVEPEVVVVVEDEVDVAPAAEAVVTETDDAPQAPPADSEVVVDVPADDDGGPPTEAVEMATLTEPDTEPDTDAALDLETLPPPEPEDEPAVAETPDPEQPKRRFGKRLRP